MSRLQLLYRLPTATAPQRQLIISPDRFDGRLVEAWHGKASVLPISALGSDFIDRAPQFDVIALPGVLGVRDVRGSDGDLRMTNGVLLKSVARMLAPGGVVVGHIDHGWSLRRTTPWRGILELAAASVTSDSIRNPKECLRALARTGFGGAECFYVLPSIHAPMGLIPSHTATARAKFLRVIRSSRGAYSTWGYAIRYSMVMMGLGGVFQNHLFFWARKPC